MMGSTRLTLTEANRVLDEQTRMADQHSLKDKIKTNPEDRLSNKSKLPVFQENASLKLVEGRDYREINLLSIRANRFAPREVYTDEMLLERSSSIAADGQFDPIHVIEDQDFPGQYIIGDGWTRVLGCIKHNVTLSLLAEVHHGKTEREISLFGYKQNENRAQHFDYDRARYYSKLIDDGMTAFELSENEGISKSILDKLSAFMRLPDSILEIAKSIPDRFTYNVAQTIQGVLSKTNENVALNLATRFKLTSKMSFRLLQEQAKSIVQSFKEFPETFVEKGQEAPEPDQTSNQDAQEEKPVEKQPTITKYSKGKLVVSNGRFKLDLKVADDKEEEFQAALKALVSQYSTEKTK